MPPPDYLVNLRISARTASGKIRISNNHMIQPPSHASAVSVAVLSRPIMVSMARLIKAFTDSPMESALALISSFLPFGMVRFTRSNFSAMYLFTAFCCAFDTVKLSPAFCLGGGGSIKSPFSTVPIIAQNIYCVNIENAQNILRKYSDYSILIYCANRYKIRV